jgi:hypothetical protein
LPHFARLQPGLRTVYSGGPRKTGRLNSSIPFDDLKELDENITGCRRICRARFLYFCPARATSTRSFHN